MKYIKRILGLPFFLILNIIGIIFHLFKISIAFILYGGEAMAYDKKTTPKMIADIYFELEKQNLIGNEKEQMKRTINDQQIIIDSLIKNLPVDLS